MSQTPLIGITTYHRNEENFFVLPTYYVDAVRRAGGIPLLIPAGEERLDELLPHLAGLILSGGGDVEPARYSDASHETIYNVSPERDQTELALVSKTLAANKPMLCICRGIQVLNVALGGTLITHLPDVVGETVSHRLPPRNPTPHAVQVMPDSRLARVMGSDSIKTASWHHQAIDQVAAGLKVVAQAPDGVIEAVEMPEHPLLLAVQWHPELTAHEDASQQRLFDEIVRMCRERQ